MSKDKSKDKNKDKIGTLSVSGTGEVRAKSDIATVRLAVLTEAKTAAQAVKENAERATRVIKSLEKIGVPTDAIATTGLNVFPITHWDKDTQTNVLDGYRAENSIAATVAVEMTGQVFDTGIEAGADQSSGVTFGIKDERPQREEALRIAVKEAYADAQVAAYTADVKLLGARTIDISEGGQPVFKRMETLSARDSSTPVLPGELVISARVHMTFEFIGK